MIPHILLILVVFLMWFLDENHIKIPYGKLILFLILWLYSGLQYNVSIDYPMYVKIQNGVLEGGHSEHLEPVWLVIRKIVSFFHFTAQGWFLFTSFIVIFLFFKGIKKLSINFYFSVLLFVIAYFYFESMNAIRQYVAIAILFSSFHFVLKREMWKYLFIILIAAQFHKSALFMLPVIFLVRIKIPDWLLLMLIILTFLGGIPLMNFLTNKILPLIVSDKYAVYSPDSIDVEVRTGLQKIFFNLLAGAFILLAGKAEKVYENVHIYINMVVLAVIIYNIFMYFQPVMRLSWYLFPFIIILIPYMLKVFTLTSQKVLQYMIIIIYIALTMRQLIEAGSVYDFNLNLFR